MMADSAPSFFADEATGCSGHPRPRAAFILAGQPRSFFEPLAQRSAVAAIKSFGADAFVFAFLTDDDDGSSKGHPSVREGNTSRAWEAIRRLRPKRVYYGPLADSLMRAPPGCNLSPDLTAPYTGPHSKPTWRVWWETWEKLRRGYGLAAEYERHHAFRFDWFVRLRPDLWYFGALPLHCRLQSDAISFPVGVVGCAPPCVNDHLAWVPRQLAQHFFYASEDVRTCRGDALSAHLRRAGPGSSVADFPRYLHWRLSTRAVPIAQRWLFVPYTILRPCDQPASSVYADCKRILFPPQVCLPAATCVPMPVDITRTCVCTVVMQAGMGWQNGSGADLSIVLAGMRTLYEDCEERWRAESVRERSAFAGCCVVGKRRRAACTARRTAAPRLADSNSSTSGSAARRQTLTQRAHPKDCMDRRSPSRRCA